MSKIISREELQKQGFFASLSTEVLCQCKRCAEKEVFTCELCRREVPYCFGASDEFEDLCDDCAVRQTNYQEHLLSI